MPKSTFPINRFALFITLLCAAFRAPERYDDSCAQDKRTVGMTCCCVSQISTSPTMLQRLRYLCLHSPADRVAIAFVRACRSLRATTHVFIARLVAAIHRVS
jgi:hypothetical protein